MNRIALILASCAGILTLSSGCAGKVTLAPETIASKNQKDWTILHAPSAPAPAPAAAPTQPAAPATR